MTNLIPMEKIRSLSDSDFFLMYTQGRLNSLDVPAREYFERQELIKEEMAYRLESKGLDERDPLHILMRRIPNVEEEKKFRAHLILYAVEGEIPNFLVIGNEDAALRIVEDFKKTGTIDVQDAFTGDISKKRVDTVAYAVTQTMYKHRGLKDVQIFPRTNGTNVPE
jgi:hypothetical protein